MKKREMRRVPVPTPLKTGSVTDAISNRARIFTVDLISGSYLLRKKNNFNEKREKFRTKNIDLSEIKENERDKSGRQTDR
jgi:hypothetical protein